MWWLLPVTLSAQTSGLIYLVLQLNLIFRLSWYNSGTANRGIHSWRMFVLKSLLTGYKVQIVRQIWFLITATDLDVFRPFLKIYLCVCERESVCRQTHEVEKADLLCSFLWMLMLSGSKCNQVYGLSDSLQLISRTLKAKTFSSSHLPTRHPLDRATV